MLWRVLKITTSPFSLSSGDQGLDVVIRDDDSRMTAAKHIDIAKSVIGDPAAWLSVICDAFNDDFTPNDFGCS